MKKRLCALLCALLMLVSFSVPTFALIVVEDETGVRYSDETYEKEEPAPESGFSAAVRKVMTALVTFWHRFGVATVIVLILAAIVITIVISEAEQKKKKTKPPKPSKKKK